MTSIAKGRRKAAGTLLTLTMLVLAGCMLMPGKFGSTLDIRKDGKFSFAYIGEIHLLALSKLAEMGNAAEASAPFEAEPCDDDGNERACSAQDLAEQKRKWEAEQAQAKERRKRDSDSMKAILGGIDPADPKAAEEFAQRLRRQAGWRKVEYLGDGVFTVDFSIAGNLDHDFTFPTVERMAMVSPFVQVSRRQDGSVRVEAPGFGPVQSGGPYAEMMKAAALAEGSKDGPRLPSLDGVFTITTDGEILANNTDVGPAANPTGQSLSWTVTSRTQSAPMALIKLTPKLGAP